MCITYSECVFVALVIQHAIRMRKIILSSAASLAVPYFPTLSHKLHDISGIKLENGTFIILRKLQRDTIINPSSVNRVVPFERGDEQTGRLD